MLLNEQFILLTGSGDSSYATGCRNQHLKIFIISFICIICWTCLYLKKRLRIVDFFADLVYLDLDILFMIMDLLLVYIVAIDNDWPVYIFYYAMYS